jgi:uncharacterized protein with HEPN domain
MSASASPAWSSTRQGGREEFQASTLVQDAVLRNLHTLTESTQRLSEAFKAEHPEIDWRGMAGFRNVLVHDYLSVDVQRVWEVIERDLPALKTRIEALLRPSKSKPPGRRPQSKKRKR